MTSIVERLNGGDTLTSGEVLDAYGRRGSTVPPPPDTDVIRASAERMISDTMSAMVAAEGILAMLKEEAETFTSEVRRHSNNLSARMSSYVEVCESAASAMKEHRESVLKVAATIADQSTFDETVNDHD